MKALIAKFNNWFRAKRSYHAFNWKDPKLTIINDTHSYTVFYFFFKYYVAGDVSTAQACNQSIKNFARNLTYDFLKVGSFGFQ